MANGTSQWERRTGRAAVRSDFRLSFQAVFKSDTASFVTDQYRRGCGCEPVVFVHIRGVNLSVSPEERSGPSQVKRVEISRLPAITAGFPRLEKKHGHLCTCTDTLRSTTRELGTCARGATEMSNLSVLYKRLIKKRETSSDFICF